MPLAAKQKKCIILRHFFTQTILVGITHSTQPMKLGSRLRDPWMAVFSPEASIQNLEPGQIQGTAWEGRSAASRPA